MNTFSINEAILFLSSTVGKDDIMENNKIDGSALAMAALDDIPSPKADAKQITGLVKQSGTITGYQLSDGAIVSKEEGVQLAKAGGISGVGVAHRKDTEYLKSLPDGTENNNLSSLPTVDSHLFGTNKVE